MGAGIVECDVTFTGDLQLICRHSQCDLHTTTNVVTIPELNAKCTTPWAPGVQPNCCTSDFTLDEIKMLCAKMDSSNNFNGSTPEEYAFGGTPNFRTDLYQAGCHRVPTHKEYIEEVRSLGLYFTPELKGASVLMPYKGEYTQEMYAQQMIDEYIEAGIPPEMVWPQSFNISDVFYWIENTDYGGQAVALDEVAGDVLAGANESTIDAWLDLLVSRNVKIVAPPMPFLVVPAPDSELLMEPSYYALAAKARNLTIITWSLERSDGQSGYYWSSLEGMVNLTSGDNLSLLHVLAHDVGVSGIFSDWPATATFYANCMNISLRSSVMPPPSKMVLSPVQLDPRPYWLINEMRHGSLKETLCRYMKGEFCFTFFLNQEVLIGLSSLLFFCVHEAKCSKEIISFGVSSFSIGHRGACLQFPEHTFESYEAAARMGAGVIECDVVSICIITCLLNNESYQT
jgi:glycerophosphoryl diester phosphodiesterase